MAALIRQWKWKPRFRCASKASELLLPSLARPPISGFNRCLWCVCGISIGRQAVDFEGGSSGSREEGAPHSTRPHFARTYSPSRSPSLALLILKCRKWANEMGDLQAHIPPARPSVLGMAVSNRGCARGTEGDRRGGPKARPEAAASLDELDEAIRFPITITNEHDHRPARIPSHSSLSLSLGEPSPQMRRLFNSFSRRRI